MRSTTASLALLAAFGAGCATGGAERSATPTAAGEPTRAPSAIALAQSEPRARETLERGRAAMARGDSATAARSFRETLRLQPTLIEAREGLGLALYEMGDLDGTVEELRALLRQRLGTAKAQSLAGATYQGPLARDSQIHVSLLNKKSLARSLQNGSAHCARGFDAFTPNV